MVLPPLKDICVQCLLKMFLQPSVHPLVEDITMVMFFFLFCDSLFLVLKEQFVSLFGLLLLILTLLKAHCGYLQSGSACLR